MWTDGQLFTRLNLLLHHNHLKLFFLFYIFKYVKLNPLDIVLYYFLIYSTGTAGLLKLLSCPKSFQHWAIQFMDFFFYIFFIWDVIERCLWWFYIISLRLSAIRFQRLVWVGSPPLEPQGKSNHVTKHWAHWKPNLTRRVLFS